MNQRKNLPNTDDYFALMHFGINLHHTCYIQIPDEMGNFKIMNAK